MSSGVKSFRNLLIPLMHWRENYTYLGMCNEPTQILGIAYFLFL